MPIKLLPKQEISRLQANERRQSIEEGVKLANRVDSLRETAAQEEASLASFRRSTLKAIKAEFDQATIERDAVLTQVENLRKELASGHDNLNHRQAELEALEQSLIKEQDILQKRMAALDTLMTETQKQSSKVKTYLQRVQNVWDVLTALSTDTDTLYQEAKVAAQEAQVRVEKVEQLAQAVENDLKVRDIEVASRERDVSIKEERLNDTAKQLREKELQLRDRELTLEREFKRLKK